jgi:hypothetical protein
MSLTIQIMLFYKHRSSEAGLRLLEAWLLSPHYEIICILPDLVSNATLSNKISPEILYHSFPSREDDW